MQVSETGESRVNGYLFVLERSLKTFLPKDVVRDAVREIESHLRDRIAAADGALSERDAIEKILADLGPPLRVAQAYSSERTIDEAVVTGRLVPVLRALWRVTARTFIGFWVALGVSVGYTLGAGFIVVAALKPFFPANVGLWVDDATGVPYNLGGQFPAPAGQHVVGGYWIVPIMLACGIAAIVFTHRSARRFLARWHARRKLASADPFVG
jgi:hypothetical protein